MSTGTVQSGHPGWTLAPGQPAGNRASRMSWASLDRMQKSTSSAQGCGQTLAASPSGRLLWGLCNGQAEPEHPSGQTQEKSVYTTGEIQASGVGLGHRLPDYGSGPLLAHCLDCK